jgi:Glycosyl hydrolase family 26
MALIGAGLVLVSLLLGSLNPVSMQARSERTVPTDARTGAQITELGASSTNGSLGGHLFGFGVGSVSQLPQLAGLARKLDRHIDIVNFFDGWSSGFPKDQVQQIAAAGALPEVTWEPWDYKLGVNQDTYSLQGIVAGKFDTYITGWAQQATRWGKPMLVRFAHEMNGNWYPWSVGVNGNTSADYVAAFRHVHNLFAAAGATNVKWVWSPNVLAGATSNLVSEYPGSQYVDMIGIDGYNFGTATRNSTWVSPSEIFSPTLKLLAKLDLGKPVVVDEVGCGQIGGSKAAWISNFVKLLATEPLVKGFLWSEFNTPIKWGVETSTSSLAAMKASLHNYWPPATPSSVR